MTPVAIPLERPCRTAREMIEAVVRQQVAAFRERQEAAQVLRILTGGEIAEGPERGRILAGGMEFGPQAVDIESAIRSAITTFEDGFYFLFVNDTQVENLDAPLPGGKRLDVMFVRLTPLAGG
jgi:hypothetical protein